MADKTYHFFPRHFGVRTAILAVASSFLFAGAAPMAQAAGLGRLTVFSALGQPLNAEIEVRATRSELTDMKARLASPDTFKQAGLDYATTLLGVRFSLEKRPDGQPVIKLTSNQPINDPFLDMLLELNWPAGRLVREYTVLLDPPEYQGGAQGQPPAGAPEAAAPLPGSPPPLAVAPIVTPPVLSDIGPAHPNIDDATRSRAYAQIQGRALPSYTPPAPPAGRPGPRVGSVRIREGEGAAPGVPAGPVRTVPGDTREVRRGDTLAGIANERPMEGVSLDQMLVGLFRANPAAFDGQNMNRLRTGAIIARPEKSAVESVAPREARRIVRAQSADWNAYRGKLADAAALSPARVGETRRESAGKITAKVEDRAERAAPKDQLKVARAEPAVPPRKRGAAAGAPKVSEEDTIARDKALREANERVAALEKNVADLQRLVELKNQSLAELQKQAMAKTAPAPAAPPVAVTPPKPATPPPPAAVTPPKPVAPPQPKPVTPPPPAVTPPPAPATPAVTPPPPAPAPVTPPPAVTPQPAPQPAAPPPAAKPAVKPPPQKPKPAPKPVQPPPEPSLLDKVMDFVPGMDNWPLVAGGLGLLACISLLLFFRRRRALAEVPEELDLSSTLKPESTTTTSLTTNSVFRSTGGQSVDTSSSQGDKPTDFSVVGAGTIDTDEVDPVAEADVYMAYGRDAQAEEILLEARQKDPKRAAIAVKLLEIYSSRKDLKQFETLATELYGETGGVGPDWEKVAALGRALNPNNPIFRGTVSSMSAASAASVAPAVSVAPPSVNRPGPSISVA
ncbi:MAG: hypothetical protein LBS70_01445, partial [Candidatus Accumulibacter sp.]|nr:hypothetical protein [Accumulibacter sp.]